MRSPKGASHNKLPRRPSPPHSHARYVKFSGQSPEGQRPPPHFHARYGEVSLAHLVGRGVFASWSDEAEFRSVFVDDESGTIAWPGGLDLAPDALQRRLSESASRAEIEQEWLEEVKRRDAELDTGAVDAIPMEDALTSARERLG